MDSLEKCIEKLSIGGRTQFADCFDNFLDLQLQFFCNNPNDRQRELFKHMHSNPDFKINMIAAMQAYGEEAEGFKDPLGDMFMHRISHGEKGQFFTPDSVSLLMSEIVGIEDGATVNDPACGSGRTLLNALKTARNEGKDIELYANDLSMTCAKMTLLNFVTNSVAGEVTCGNALTLDYEHFTFFKIDRLRHMVSGTVFSTYWEYTLATAREVEQQRRKWWLDIAEKGWIKHYRIKQDALPQEHIDKFEDSYTLPTEIKTGTQLSLFE